MSTLTVATVKSNSSSPPVFQNISGTQVGTLCRAWANFNMSGTLAIRNSFNVSSIVDNGTDVTVNFTNAMPDATYSIVTSQSYQLGATYVQGMQAPWGVYSATQFGMQPFTGNSPFGEAQFLSFAVFR